MGHDPHTWLSLRWCSLCQWWWPLAIYLKKIHSSIKPIHAWLQHRRNCFLRKTKQKFLLLFISNFVLFIQDNVMSILSGSKINRPWIMLDNNVTLHIYNDLAMKFWLESLTTYKKQEPTSSLSHLTSSWIRFRQEVQVFLFLPLCRPSLSTSQNFNSGSVVVLRTVKSECPQRPWCRQQHEAFGGISRLIKWITLLK